MAHARQQIRDALKAILISASTGAGSNIYSQRVYPLDVVKSIDVQSPNDSLMEETMGGNQTRELTLMIDIRIKGDSGVTEDEVDDIAAEVEVAVQNDDTLTGTVMTVDYVGSSTRFNGESEKLVGMLSIEYSAIYRVNKTNPEVIIP